MQLAPPALSDVGSPYFGNMVERMSAQPSASFDGGADELLTVEEAAAILKVKPSTIRHWVREGRMPCYRLGPRATRFTRELLRQFVERSLAA
jgi:excisionase family DNA binding protein